MVPGCFGDFLSSVTNFSIQYNYVCASIAAAIMLSDADRTGDSVAADFPQPQWAKDFLMSVVFVGSIVGMLVMGFLGDLIGVQRALVLTNSFVVLGALSSALLSWGESQRIWAVITASRFVLGIGVGGGYPLSAAKAAQSASPGQGIENTVKAFFWQGPGSLAPYLVALLLLRLPRFEEVTSVQFRVLLGLGAIPAMVVVFVSCDRGGSGTRSPQTAPQGSSRVSNALRDPQCWRKLFGTACTWFLFDIALYSMVIFSPTIIQHIFGSQTSLVNVATRAAMMAIIAVAGTACGIAAVVYRIIQPKWLNILGFSGASMLFAGLSFLFAFAPESVMELFGLLCCLFFLLYAGPNVATFVMPVTTFEPDVRGTFGGLSSACGKTGAMVGALIYPSLDEHLGVSKAMFLMAVLCALGALTSWLCLEEAEQDQNVGKVGDGQLEMSPVMIGSGDEDSVASTVSSVPGCMDFCARDGDTEESLEEDSIPLRQARSV